MCGPRGCGVPDTGFRRHKDCLDVNFQEVVHSDLAGNADVTKPQ
jgi:hypothetical protein